MDKTKILLNNSSFSTIANYLSTLSLDTLPDGFLKQTVDNIFSKTRIINLNVFRKRVTKLETGQNKLGVSKEDQESFIHPTLNNSIENSYDDAIPVLIASYSDSGPSSGIFRIENTGIFGFHRPLFSFRDKTFDKSDKGAYQYFYEVSIEDGISKELENLFADALQNFTKLENYLNFINGDLKKYYNQLFDTFNISNIEADYENKNQIDINVMLAKCVLSMTNAWTILGINNSSLSESQPKLVKIASPDSGNYQGLLKFYKLYNTFIEKMLKISGFNKDILSTKMVFRQQGDKTIREFITPNAAFGTI